MRPIRWKSKQHKFRAQSGPTLRHPGRSFASKLEAAVYDLLLFEQKAGEWVGEIRQQPHVYLTDARILIIPDFVATRPDGTEEWIEAKGHETDVWRIKRKLWTVYGCGPLRVYKGSHRNPVLAEVIIPKGVK